MSIIQVLNDRMAERHTVAPSFKQLADPFFAKEIKAMIKRCRQLTNSKDLSEITAAHLVEARNNTPFMNAFVRADVIGAAYDLPE